MALAPLPVEAYRDLVARALAEDIGQGDVTSRVVVDADLPARGVILAKAPLVVAGLDVAFEVFRQCDPDVVVDVRWGDGAHCERGETVAVVTGRARALLTAERTALNLLQRLSGIATLTAAYVDTAAGRITVLDTRKTTPTFRALEKYAVRCGGGANHRFGLDDAVLIKDNHLVVAGGVAAAVERARCFVGHLVKIEVEVATLAQLDEALAVGVEAVLLDNFDVATLRGAVVRVAGRAITEASGGITLATARAVADTGVDLLSVGALTHSAPALDVALDFD